ncbi:tubulin monoglutamylase TTLL4-like isoform X2 [Artemia franciscana]|uniref:Tubulin polyglutamylase TTLL4 n=1 Tax=Artemia franciscana TaxID=6661 RepID=A0AA88L3R2_ARTSF|nr:hypothetical protein QYM36_012658 [Artemia franciscana]KAK2711576.1 hypothetical protein QYM36_012658 [Artemia franciscana]KAK2711581.1 hypothetical protein QYM36_012658 [Artemia franciscana]KAK2711582.1 hypothetical protein QYM36_012658 [Artemia franciscana]
MDEESAEVAKQTEPVDAQDASVDPVKVPEQIINDLKPPLDFVPPKLKRKRKIVKRKLGVSSKTEKTLVRTTRKIQMKRKPALGPVDQIRLDAKYPLIPDFDVGSPLSIDTPDSCAASLVSTDSDFPDSVIGLSDDDSSYDDAEQGNEDSQSSISGYTSMSSVSVTQSRDNLSSSLSEENGQIRQIKPGEEDTRPRRAVVRVSRFSNLPPFIYFPPAEERGADLPQDLAKNMKWKLSTITPLVVREALKSTGFRLIKSKSESKDWMGMWGKHMKSIEFSSLKATQKINHFPGTFQIGRKDRLWRNIRKLEVKFGVNEFGFLPQTYVLPYDLKSLRKAWKKTSSDVPWIIKPPASARGQGIKVIHRWDQLSSARPLVVQEYKNNPYLISGTKFDIRMYVLITSFDPLKIYLYEDGLVRFASMKYSSEMTSLGDNFIHLTNYSINKHCDQYIHNEDAGACKGSKWTLKSLWNYLRNEGADVDELLMRIRDLVIKTVVSGEGVVNRLCNENLKSTYQCYELLGFDILLDTELRPWLLEVNISPSLHSSSSLDVTVKGPLIREVFNLARFHFPSKFNEEKQKEMSKILGIEQEIGSFCMDGRLYSRVLSMGEKEKIEDILLSAESGLRQEWLGSILEDLKPCDIRQLVHYEDEQTQLVNFRKIFPTPESHRYLKYMEYPRYFNLLLDAWENKYSTNRRQGLKLLDSFCCKGIHLEVPQIMSNGATATLEPHSTTSLPIIVDNSC